MWPERVGTLQLSSRHLVLRSAVVSSLRQQVNHLLHSLCSNLEREPWSDCCRREEWNHPHIAEDLIAAYGGYCVASHGQHCWDDEHHMLDTNLLELLAAGYRILMRSGLYRYSCGK